MPEPCETQFMPLSQIWSDRPSPRPSNIKSIRQQHPPNELDCPTSGLLKGNNFLRAFHRIASKHARISSPQISLSAVISAVGLFKMPSPAVGGKNLFLTYGDEKKPSSFLHLPPHLGRGKEKKKGASKLSGKFVHWSFSLTLCVLYVREFMYKRNCATSDSHYGGTVLSRLPYMLLTHTEKNLFSPFTPPRLVTWKSHPNFSGGKERKILIAYVYVRQLRSAALFKSGPLRTSSSQEVISWPAGRDTRKKKKGVQQLEEKRSPECLKVQCLRILSMRTERDGCCTGQTVVFRENGEQLYFVSYCIWSLAHWETEPELQVEILHPSLK